MPTHLNVEQPEALRRWRSDRGWTPNLAARAFRVPVSRYRMWEEGAAPLDDVVLARLARDAGVPLSRLRAALGLAPRPLPDPSGWREGDLAGLLGRWREHEQLSVRAAARCLGVSPTALASWERGRIPSPQRLHTLADLWRVGYDDVRRAAGPDRVRRAETVGGSASTPLVLARQAAGMSQAQFAGALSVSVPVLSRWECSEHRPSTSDVVRIAAVLGLPFDDAEALFDGCPVTRRRDLGRLPGLRVVLRAHGLDSGDVSAALRVPPALASDWVRGRRAVPREVLEEIGRLLGTDLRPQVDRLRRRPCGTPTGPRHPLAVRRTALGLTQRGLADTIGVARTTISSWECGRTIIPRSRLRPLATALRWESSRAAVELGLPAVSVPDLGRTEPHQLPDTLRALRTSTGFTAAQLGRAVGVTGATVRRWESGGAVPSVASLTRLAIALGVGRATLLNAAGRGEPSPQRDRRLAG